MNSQPRIAGVLRLLTSGVVAILASHLHAATSISQYGITWTFAADMQTGQFANGDYWVVGPVTITNITPASTVVAGRTMNGSMVNPTAGISVQQGFDSSMTANSFNAALNVARPGGNDLSPSNPLVLAVGSSLISTISHPTAKNRPQLTDAAVLTVLATPPPTGAFRPPYCGTDKTIIATEADIDYSKVASLAKPAATPNLATVSGYFTRPWIEIHTEFGGREMHPINNQPNYGRDLSNQLEEGLLSLQLDYTNAEKRDLMVRLIQYGLDVYGAARTGGFWIENGGHNQGRKMPLLLAATVLNNSAIREYADTAKYFIFHEDRQTFIVSQATVDLTNSALWKPDTRAGTPEPYTAGDIGLPEWGITHVKNPAADNKFWGTVYRDTVGGSAFGHVLTAHIMGLRSVWNWEPVFLYFDRYYEIMKAKAKLSGNDPTPFEMQMWAAYRNFSLSPPATTPPSITSHPASTVITAGANVNFAVTATGTAPLTYQWQYNGSPIGGATGTSYSITGATVGQSGPYTVVVTNAKGSATSNPAVLTVNAAPPVGTTPLITTQPASVTVNQGGNVTFSVAATGTAPLAYQWRKDGSNIPGAISASLTITNAAASQAGSYNVVVSNGLGSATSDSASLVVVTPPPPPPPTVPPTNASVQIQVSP